MKQGKIFLRVLSILFLMAVAAYLLLSVTSAVTDPLSTTVAIAYEASETTLVEGVVIRQEQLLYSNWAITNPALEEGERVGAGQTLAMGYQTQNDARSRIELTRAQRRLAQMKAVCTTQVTSTDVAELELRIAEQVTAVNAALASGEWGAAQDGVWDVQTSILQRTADAEDRSQAAAGLAELSALVTGLEQKGSTGGAALPAPAAGWYSAGVDGYEGLLDPEKAMKLTTADLAEMKDWTTTSTTGAYGRLVTGNTWYYAAVMDQEVARQVQRMGTVPVDFAAAELTTDMKVAQVGTVNDEGKCVVVLSCTDYLSQAASLRFEEANVVFTSCQGLRIPKTAIRSLSKAEAPQREDGEAPEEEPAQEAEAVEAPAEEALVTGVYVIEGGRAVFKEVEILMDTGSAYVVREDQSSTYSLWAGDEVIVSARDLYDGKVVREA